MLPLLVSAVGLDRKNKMSALLFLCVTIFIVDQTMSINEMIAKCLHVSLSKVLYGDFVSPRADVELRSCSFPGVLGS